MAEMFKPKTISTQTTTLLGMEFETLMPEVRSLTFKLLLKIQIQQSNQCQHDCF